MILLATSSALSVGISRGKRVFIEPNIPALEMWYGQTHVTVIPILFADISSDRSDSENVREADLEAQ